MSETGIVADREETPGSEGLGALLLARGKATAAGLERAERLAETGERLMRAIEASEVEETPRRRVEAGFRAYFRFFEESPAAFALLYGTSLTIDPDFRRDARRVRDTFAEYLTGLIRTVDHESALAMAAGINGLSEGMIRHWMHEENPRPAEEMAALAARLAWGGLESLA